MQDLVTASYQQSYQEEASSLLGEFEMSTQELDECGTESVVRVTLINQGFQQALMHAIGKMTEARLQIDHFGFNMPNAAAMASGCDEKRLSDKLTILVNDITIVMQRLQYASYRGKIYKRDARSKYTYSYKCEARALVNTLATNENFKSRLIRDMRKVIELLSDQHCELFQPLVIDYDLVHEVLVPNTLALVFNIDLSGGHANNFLVQNVSRTLVDKLVVKFTGETLEDTVSYDVYKTFQDLFLAAEKRDNMFPEGIQSDDLCKIRSGSGDKKTSGVDAEKKLAEVYGTKNRINLDHQILTDHGIFSSSSPIQWPLVWSDSSTCQPGCKRLWHNQAGIQADQHPAWV